MVTMLKTVILIVAVLYADAGGRRSTEPPPSPDGSCGRVQVSTSKVIGGKNAKPGAWPWQVALQYNGRFQCGGSLIAPQWIVTAAHCTSYKTAAGYRVITGETDRMTNEGREKVHQVSGLFNHPSYDRYTLNNDIALMKLAKPVTMSRYVQPVCLPASEAPAGTTCYITGWGKIVHPGGAHRYLQEAALKIIDQKTCYALNTAQSRFPAVRRDSMVCGGHGPNDIRSGCHGDSGGPFVCKSRSGAWELQGAVSWGSPQCNTKQAYTVFARVTNFKKWISDTIKRN